MAIPATLVYFTARRKDAPFPLIFWMFGLFIVSCGFTHFMDVYTFQHPVYRLSGLIKAITAVASIGTVIALIPITPKALALPAVSSLNKQLQAEVRERTRAEERFRSVVEFAPHAMFEVDPDGNVGLVNSRLEALLGYSREELLGRPPEFFTTGSSPLTLEALHAMEGPQTVVCRGRDGAGIAVEVSASRLESELGPLTLVAMVDLRERAQAQQALRESEERYRSLVAATTSVVWLGDETGALTMPQESWATFTGQSWEETFNGGWINAVHPDDRARLQDLWNTAVARKSVYRSEGRIWHAPSGEYRYFIGRAVPILKPDGSVREWIGTVTDVDDRRRAEERLKSSLQELQKKNEEMEHFNYTVSHDLKSPLVSIQGFATHAARDLAADRTDRVESFIREIQTAADDMKRLIDDLLQLSRLGRKRGQPTRLNVDELIDEAAEEHGADRVPQRSRHSPRPAADHLGGSHAYGADI